MVGKQLNGYKLLKHVGEGGMANVYYAENALQKPAAIKVLKKKFAHDEGVNLRFMNEAKIMVHLDHPNIRDVYDVGTIDEQPAIIMEYLSGLSFKDAINKNISDASLKQYFKECQEALAYTHQQGIIHRDIKPSNIFITDKNQVKILDFGIAKSQIQGGFTATGQRMGTVIYMSPEQVKDPKRVTTKTDVYSLGVSFYQALTRNLPYDLNTDSEYTVLNKIVNEPIDITQVPKGWQTILNDCLVKDPKQRKQVNELSFTTTKNEETVIENITNKQKTITETNNNEQKPNKSKLPLYIGLVAVLGVIGFLGTQWLNKQPIKKNEKPTTAKLDSIAFSKLNTTNKDSLQFFIDKFKESEYTTIVQAKLDSIIKIEESINGSNKVKAKQKEIEVAWQKAKRLHTSSSYTAFISKYPNSKYTSEARKQKNTLIVSEEKEKQRKREKEKRNKYDYVGRFKEGLARVKKNDKWGFINKDDEEVIPLIYNYVGEGFNKEGLVKVRKYNWGFVDKIGKEVTPLIYHYADDFTEGLARVGKNGKWGFINKNGKEVIPLIYNRASSFNRGFTTVEKNGKWGLVNKNGKEVIPIIYDYAWGFSEGLAGVEKNGKWGFVNKSGKEVIPLIYSSANGFNKGFAEVKKNGKWFFINKQGKCVKDCD